MNGDHSSTTKNTKPQMPEMWVLQLLWCELLSFYLPHLWRRNSNLAQLLEIPLVLLYLNNQSLYYFKADAAHSQLTQNPNFSGLHQIHLHQVLQIHFHHIRKGFSTLLMFIWDIHLYVYIKRSAPQDKQIAVSEIPIIA